MQPDPHDSRWVTLRRVFRWKPLERASGLVFTNPQRLALVEALYHYIIYLDNRRVTPRTNDVTHRLEGIYHHADALFQLFSLHLKNEPRDDYEFNLMEAVFGELSDHVDRKTCLRLLSELRIQTRKALTRIRERARPGREGKSPLDGMIRTWHAVYQQAGGRGRGCTRSGGASQANGPFLDLIDAVFTQVIKSEKFPSLQDAIPPTRDALAQRIIAALKPQRGPNSPG
jgi:hypothetical protein